MTFKFKEKSIYYKCFGKGRAIVLLHGFLESSLMWENSIPHLSRQNNVISVDLPGHGKSEILAEIHTMEIMAEVVFRLLNHIKIPSATIIGHSMGGYVALAFAEMHSEKLDKLILINSTTKEDDPERKVNRERAITLLKKNPKAFISMAISNLVSEEANNQFASEIEVLKADAYTFPIDGIIANIQGMKIRKDRTEILANLKKPKYIIAGIEDCLIPVSISEEIAEETNSEFFKLNGGHLAMVENESEVLVFLQGTIARN